MIEFILRLETVMKKALLFFMCAMLLTACTGYNNSTSVTENGVYYNISSNHKEAMAHSFRWDGKEDNNVITIPDTLSDGTQVKKIGGFIGIGVPASFGIDYYCEWPALPKSSKPMSEEEAEAFYRDYIDNHPDELLGRLVKLDMTEESSDASPVSGSEDSTVSGEGGDNEAAGAEAGNGPSVEREILYDINHHGILQPDGTVLVYRATLYFNVDPENKTYYSEDGVLYTTADGQPVVY